MNRIRTARPHASSTRVALAVSCWLTSMASLAMAQETPSDAARPPVVVTEAALALHRSCLLVDGHNDLPYAARGKADPYFKQFDIAKSQPDFNTDIPRLRAGGVGWQFWSAYVPAETRFRGESLSQTLEQIDLVHRMVERYSDTFEMASTADDVERIHAEGKIASMIGVEGGHSIQNSIGVLRQLYALGVRYMTLTHSDTLDWADSATDDAKSGGLSPFGEEIVREMNRLGMLVDISHVSAETMHDALDVSRAPIIASHSSAYGVAAHPRNVPDDVLVRLKKNGGVVMVNFFSGFVVPEAAEKMARMFDVRRELAAKYGDDEEAFDEAYTRWKNEQRTPPGTVHTVVDHIDYIVRVAGIDHVGLGSDFDGVSQLPDQLEDVSTYPVITQELLNRGYSDGDIRKILGGNVLRALRGAEKVSREMTASSSP